MIQPKRLHILTLLLWAGTMLPVGCTAGPPRAGSAGGTYASRLAQINSELKGQRYRTLLNFENGSDTVFVQGDSPLQITPGGHGGGSALAVPGGSGRLSVNITSLLYGKPLGDTWTLLGAYFRSPAVADVSLVLEADGLVLRKSRATLPGGVWTFAAIDLAADPAVENRLSAAREIRLIIEPTRPQLAVDGVDAGLNGGRGGGGGDSGGRVGRAGGGNGSGGGGALLLDDVLLSNNTTLLVNTASADSLDGWAVVRRGGGYLIVAPGRFNMQLPDAASDANGWTLIEANPLRARFHAPRGATGDLTVFVDGRSMWDGRFRSLAPSGSPVERLAAEHETPAEFRTDEATARLERNTPGDANNDGYNEHLGAYTLVALGSRVEFTIVPRTPSLTWPIVQIRDLPPGQVRATIEGKLIDTHTRLPDGTLLLKLPVRIDQPARVQVTIE